MGAGHFVAPKTLEVRLNDGGTRMLVGDQLFINIGTHAAIPNVPGLDAAGPLTNIEALELDYMPQHLIVLGGGYVGLEIGTGISPIWQPRDDRRAWTSDRWTGGSGRCGGDAADPQ